MSARAVLLLLLSFLALLPGPAAARELHFITIDVAPWASRDADGLPVGVFPDVVRELERRTGLSITMSLEPFARVERELAAGRQDCTIIIWDEARAPVVERGATVAPHRLGVVARRGVRLEAYTDLHELTVSVLRGVVIEPRFDADHSIRKDFDTDYPMGLRKLAHGRVDAVAGAITTIRHLAERGGLDEYLGAELALSEVPLVLQCARSSSELRHLPRLNEAVARMVEDGTIDRIKREHRF